MGMVQKRKKMHSTDTHSQRRWRVRNRRRNLNEIDNDMHSECADLINQTVNLHKPGFAQFYCIHCAKYFTDYHALQSHFRTKVHKRRLRALQTESYGSEEVPRAAGKGNNKKSKKRVGTKKSSKVDGTTAKGTATDEQAATGNVQPDVDGKNT